MIVAVDFLFLRDLTWLRLVVNVGIVLVFGLLSFRIFGRSKVE